MTTIVPAHPKSPHAARAASPSDGDDTIEAVSGGSFAEIFAAAVDHKKRGHEQDKEPAIARKDDVPIERADVVPPIAPQLTSAIPPAIATPCDPVARSDERVVVVDTDALAIEAHTPPVDKRPEPVAQPQPAMSAREVEVVSSATATPAAATSTPASARNASQPPMATSLPQAVELALALMPPPATSAPARTKEPVPSRDEASKPQSTPAAGTDREPLTIPLPAVTTPRYSIVAADRVAVPSIKTPEAHVGPDQEASAPTPASGVAANAVMERNDVPLQVTVPTPVGASGWAQEVGNGISHAITLGKHSAQLHLTPANLGPIDVRIDMSGDQATVALVASHATTRDALSDALPMLRELLATQGLALADAAIESRTPRDSPKESSAGAQTASQGSATAIAVPVSEVSLPSRRLLDVYV